MTSPAIYSLAGRINADPELREMFRRNAVETIASMGYVLDQDDSAALQSVDWSAMTDDELTVRLSGAARRGTYSTC